MKDRYDSIPAHDYLDKNSIPYERAEFSPGIEKISGGWVGHYLAVSLNGMPPRSRWNIMTQKPLKNAGL